MKYSLLNMIKIFKKDKILSTQYLRIKCIGKDFRMSDMIKHLNISLTSFKEYQKYQKLIYKVIILDLLETGCRLLYELSTLN